MKRLDTIIAAVALLGLVLILAGCGQGPALVGVPPANAPDVKLTAGNGIGSGTHIGGGYIISAAHVTETEKALKVRFADGQVTEAQVLWRNADFDLALLRYEDHGQASAAHLACRDPRDGEPILAVGNPLSLEHITTRGFVAGEPRQQGPWTMVSPTDLTVIPGMSGGAIYDEVGDMIGVSVGTALWPIGMFPTWGRLGFIVPGKTVCEMLARST